MTRSAIGIFILCNLIDSDPIGKYLFTDPAVSLYRSKLVQSAVTMFVIIKTGEVEYPFPRFVNIRKALIGIIGPIFDGSEDGFGIGIIITYLWSAS